MTRRGEAAEQPARKTPSAAQRKGKRGHDENGNVRPADGRWELHNPKDESKHVTSPKSA